MYEVGANNQWTPRGVLSYSNNTCTFIYETKFGEDAHGNIDLISLNSLTETVEFDLKIDEYRDNKFVICNP